MAAPSLSFWCSIVPSSARAHPWVPRVGCMVLFLLCGFAPSGKRDPRPLTVGKITIEQRQIFDEPDTTFLHAVAPLANRLHVLTDEEVIRRELLFKEGDRYNQKLVDESARNLRRLGIIWDIHIVGDTLPNNMVNVTVTARDRWTLYPSLSIRGGGGVSGFAVSVKDENFLGSAQQVNLGYNRLSDRAHPDGGEAGFVEPRLFGSWWGTSASVKYSDELKQGALGLSHPFSTDEMTWAARAYADAGRVRLRQYDSGILLHEYYLNQQNQLAWFARSTEHEPKFQYALGYYRERTSSDSLQPRPFENLDLLLASFSLLQRSYVKGRNLDNFGRVEDVPLGYQAGVTVGRNLRFSRAGNVDYFLRLSGLVSLGNGISRLECLQASATSFFIGNVPDQTTIAASATEYWRLSEYQTLVGRVMTTVGSHWDPASQVVLGTSSGLRGYNDYELTGQRMLLLNIEERSYSLLHFWFLKLGGAVFFDSGVVWDQGEGFSGQRFHNAAGLGLRIESARSSGSGIIRIDLAYNFDRRMVRLVFSTDHAFRAVTPIEYVEPVPTTGVGQSGRY